MAEDSGNFPTKNSSKSNGGPGGANNAPGKSTATSMPSVPSGFNPVRRAVTVDESAQLRHQPSSSLSSFDRSFDGAPRRRGSTFSEYSLNEARRNLQDDILNPSGPDAENQAASSWASLPLAFAILPAVGGLFFKNGSLLITDVMLLGLAAIFLRWSITQPWIWYHSAQEVRVREETTTRMVMEDESNAEAAQGQSQKGKEPNTMEDVPEEDGKPQTSTPPYTPADVSRQSRQAALNELYAHEVMALTSCFLFPLLAAYLLHTIRNQLSRPSEGLVSNFNLTIFILGAEIHPLSHMLKLVRARTLHLQRVVNANPYKETSPTLTQVQDMARRLAELESHAAAGLVPASSQASNGILEPGKQSVQHNAALVREVRNAIQPELDALNRAVRRYEKKATVLAFQTESRLGAIDLRLNDAISLAASAAKNSASQGSFLGWLAERATALAMMPVRAVLKVVTLPFRAITSVVRRDNGEFSEKGLREHRTGKGGSSGRLTSSDRVPTRLSKR